MLRRMTGSDRPVLIAYDGSLAARQAVANAAEIDLPDQPPEACQTADHRRPLPVRGGIVALAERCGDGRG